MDSENRWGSALAESTAGGCSERAPEMSHTAGREVLTSGASDRSALIAEVDGLRQALAAERAANVAAKTQIADLRRALAMLSTELPGISEDRRRLAEFEVRVDELARANLVVSRTSARLASNPHIDSYLGYVLVEVCKQIGADAGHLTTFDPGARTLETAALVEDGVLLTNPPLGVMPVVGENFFDLIVREGRPRGFDITSEAHLFFPGSCEYLLSKGLTFSWAIPLMVEGRPVGHIGIAARTQRTLVDEMARVIETLAHQAALAIQLTRLSQQASQAAVARAEEKAALDRVAVLERLTDAGRSSLSHLARRPGAEPFLSRILRVAAGELLAVGGAVWVKSQSAAPGKLLAAFERGKLHASVDGYRNEPDIYAALEREFEFATSIQSATEHAHKLKMWDVRAFESSPDLRPCQRYFEERSVKTIAVVPMVLGGVVKGAILLRFPQVRALTADEEGLAYSLSNQAVLAVELTKLGDMAKSAAATAAVTEERDRIAKELHDGLSQCLTGILMNMRTSKAIGSTNQPEGDRALARAEALAERGLMEMRQVVAALGPDATHSSDLVSRLGELVAQTKHTALPAQLTVKGAAWKVAPDIGRQLLFIAREALANAQRYSGGTVVEFELEFGSMLKLTIVDDGHGIGSAEKLVSGAGLTNMRCRAERVGGTVEIRSDPGRGVCVCATVPPRRYAHEA